MTIPLAKPALDALERHNLESHAGLARFLVEAGAVVVPASEVSWRGSLPWEAPVVADNLVRPAPPRFVLRLDVPMEVVKAWMIRPRAGVPWLQMDSELLRDHDAYRDEILTLWMSRRGRPIEALIKEWDTEVPQFLPLGLAATDDFIFHAAGKWILGSRWDDPTPLPVCLNVSGYVQRGLGGRFNLRIPEDDTP